MVKKIQQICAYILFVINEILNFDKACFGRTLKWDPWGKVWISWYPKLDRHGKMDWTPLLNVFMFTPMLFLLCGMFPKFFERRGYVKGLLIGFVSSLTIELLQVATCLGTFQVADLVYNTISGAIGVLLFNLCQKRYYQKRIYNKQFI